MKRRRLTSADSAGLPAIPPFLGGKPIVRGMRISVELILSLLAEGPRGHSGGLPGLEGLRGSHKSESIPLSWEL